MIAIVGGGLAGLVCAKTLHEAGRDFVLIEASDRLGGCQRTEEIDGCRLDVGFQILLTSYPALHRHLDVVSLEMQNFQSGALLWDRGDFFRMLDPIRHPEWFVTSALSPAFPIADRARLAGLVSSCVLHTDASLLARCASSSDESTRSLLTRMGFQPPIIDRFFEPFFGGVFLEDELSTSAGLFCYYLKKFAAGRAVIPRGGIDAVPRQLASRLPASSIRLETPVVELEVSGERVTAVHCGSGDAIAVDKVIVATEPRSASSLLRMPAPPRWTSVTTIYFRTPRKLYQGPLLVLPAGSNRLVRHLHAPTNIDASLAPEGWHLVCASCLDDRNLSDSKLFAAAAAEIEEMFPNASGTLEPLAVFRIRDALPFQPPGFGARKSGFKPPANVILAIDPTLPASSQFAMDRGEIAAHRALSA